MSSAERRKGQKAEMERVRSQALRSEPGEMPKLCLGSRQGCFQGEKRTRRSMVAAQDAASHQAPPQQAAKLRSYSYKLIFVQVSQAPRVWNLHNNYLRAVKKCCYFHCIDKVGQIIGQGLKVIHQHFTPNPLRKIPFSSHVKWGRE